MRKIGFPWFRVFNAGSRVVFVTKNQNNREAKARLNPPSDVKIILAAYAEIIGTKDKVFNSGSRLQLVCVLTLATSKPDYIFW